MAGDNRSTMNGEFGADPKVVIQRRSSPAAAWLIGVSLAVIALCMVARMLTVSNPSVLGSAMAQSVGTSGAQGVFAFTGQLANGDFGVFMVDVDAGTIWCYEVVTGKHTLKLVAARNWRYDRYLENYQTDPPPQVIKDLLEDQRQAKLSQDEP